MKVSLSEEEGTRQQAPPKRLADPQTEIGARLEATGMSKIEDQLENRREG
jgi:hypothetical protein